MVKIPCAKCGSCTTVCPVYQITGRESLTARGRLHLLEKLADTSPSIEYIDIFSRCLLCNACKSGCPRGIDLPSMVIETRRDFPALSGEGSFKKHLAKKLLASDKLLNRIAALLKLSKPVLENLPKNSGLRLKLGIMAEGAVDSHANSEIAPSEDHVRSRIKLFKGCLATHFFPQIEVATRKILSGKPDYVTAPPEQHCCGLASYSCGDFDTARDLARKNIETFGNDDSYIISPCASCYSHLKAYPELLKNDPQWAEKAQRFALRITELSTYLSVTSVNSPAPETENILRVFYHDPCHLRFRQGDHIRPPREIISSIPGIELIDLPRGPRCCGLGGLFNLSHPDLSKNIGKPLIIELKEINPDIILSTCSGCILQLKFLIASDEDLDIEVDHLAHFIQNRV